LPFQRQNLATEYFYVQKNVEKLSEKQVFTYLEKQKIVGMISAYSAVSFIDHARSGEKNGSN
jgi:hypothetical protein